MNFLYPAAAEAFLDGTFSWTGDDWRDAVIDGQVTETDMRGFTEFSDVPTAAVINDVALGNPTLVNGGALSDFADHGTLAAEITRTIYRHVIYHDSTDLLVAHYDTSMFGPISRTIDGLTPVQVIPHPTGWFRFTNL